MHTYLDYNCYFHPVGQGLFSSATLRSYDKKAGHTCFRWVYDCGTVSSQDLVKDALASADLAEIDILFISHFDWDHISGVARLLAGRKVHRIVLPLLSLSHRIFLSTVTRRGNRRLVLEPAAAIAGEFNIKPNQVYFVPSTSESRGAEDAERQIEPGDELELQPRIAVMPDEKIIPGTGERAGATGGNVIVPGSVISVSALWEFVPFNFPSPSPLPAGFEQKVQSDLDGLVAAGNEAMTDRYLRLIKRRYQAVFRTAEKRNLISLFVYSGPLLGLVNNCRTHMRYSERTTPNYRTFATEGMGGFKTGALYTGDGYLNHPHLVAALARHIGQRRSSNINTFQVPHHGARKNWHRDALTQFDPNFCVFSSDPTRKRPSHPHASVRKDCQLHGPVQVCKNYGAHFGACWIHWTP